MAKVLVDVSPLGGGHGARGIGRYVAGLVSAIGEWPREERSSICGVGASADVSAQIPTISYAAMGFRRTDLGWLTARLAFGLAARRTGSLAVHSTDPFHPWMPPGLRQLVTVYDLIPLHERDMLNSWRIHHRSLYRAYLRQVSQAAQLIAISRATADDVSNCLGIAADRISIVYPAIAAPVKRAREKPEQPTFLHVGAVDPHKQPRLAIEALAAFVSLEGEGRLRFVGPISDEQTRGLADYARELRVVERVTFDGRLSDELLDDAYAAATAVVSTSRIEGFGLGPIEALCRGVPVIAVDTPAARETIGAFGSLVPSDADAIADAMTRPVQPDGAMANELLNRYSPSAPAEALREAYERVLS